MSGAFRLSAMTARGWRYLAAAYLIFYVAAVVIERHGLERSPMYPIEMILTAPIMWGFAVYGLQRGSVMARTSWVGCSENPLRFWSIIAFEFLFGLFLFFWGMRDAFR